MYMCLAPQTLFSFPSLLQRRGKLVAASFWTPYEPLPPIPTLLKYPHSLTWKRIVPPIIELACLSCPCPPASDEESPLRRQKKDLTGITNSSPLLPKTLRQLFTPPNLLPRNPRGVPRVILPSTTYSGRTKGGLGV